MRATTTCGLHPDRDANLGPALAVYRSVRVTRYVAERQALLVEAV